jgi:putative glutamine amidotransferase
MKIGITISETNFQNYPDWIKGNYDIEIIELSYLNNNIQDLNICDGLLLTGGVDIKPEIENYENAPTQFNTIRDAFEMKILSLALSRNIPILGICRGMQLINLYFGGSLILDLGQRNISHKKQENDNIHSIQVDKKSALYNIVGVESGDVNSAHHQAINQLANCLIMCAKSSDGVVEAIELIDKKDQFLLAVQWHPERMNNPKSPFAKNIREAFLENIKSKIQ